MTSATADKEIITTKKKRGIPMWLQILIWTVMVASTVYATKTRSLRDFLHYGPYIALGFSITFILVFTAIIITKGLRKVTVKTYVGIFSIIVVLPIIAGITYYSFFASIKDIFFWVLSPKFSKTSGIILTSIFVLCTGLGLFYFRLHMRAIYGITEAAIGIIIGAYRVSTQKDPLSNSDFYLAILSASVFLIVRGFDNIHQGLYKEPVDNYGARLLRFLTKRA